MLLNRVYQPRWALQQLPSGLRLRGTEWRVLLSVDGMAPAEAIRQHLGLAPEECASVIRKLEQEGLLVEKEVSIEELARAVALTHAGTETPQSIAEFIGGTPVTVAEVPEVTADAPEILPEPVVVVPPPFVPLQSPLLISPSLPFPSSNPPPPKSMSLRAIINFILNQSSDSTTGQLAVYRVFMGVNTTLLKRNGITSLRFQDDRLIEDPELQQAIRENIERSLNLRCPEDVFVSA